jgi:hypothetical protein
MAALSIGGIFLVIMALAHGVNCCYPGARWGFSIDGFWMPPVFHFDVRGAGPVVVHGRGEARGQ